VGQWLIVELQKPMTEISIGGRRTKILLIEDDAHAGKRAATLISHGYEMHTAGTAEVARVLWDNHRPDLILLALTNDADGILQLWEGIRRLAPQQRIAFLHGESLYLSPVLFNGEIVRHGEGPEDFVGKIKSLLASAAPGAANV
jgi:hypothetical protein